MSVCLTERRIEVYGGNSNGTVLADCIYSDFNIANYSITGEGVEKKPEEDEPDDEDSSPETYEELFEVKK